MIAIFIIVDTCDSSYLHVTHLPTITPMHDVSIVQLLCHNNRDAEIYCAQYIQTILDHFPLDIGAADTFAVDFCLLSRIDRNYRV